ncbi:MAG: EAL domain-containing protein [Gemmatimonadota bacterium]|nr:EAL domain-containing protein [Gemmatimonadota bacterium]
MSRGRRGDLDSGELYETLRSRASPEENTPPRRAVFLTLACLLAAMTVSLTDLGSAARYSSFVWILAILPVFLLSYYRGWQGASLAAVFGMLALTAVEVIGRVQGGAIDWWLVGTATTLLVPITIGSGMVSEVLRRQRALAMEMAYGDPMTNVANRRWLREAVAQAIKEAQENNVGVGLIFLDLVDFKRVNDRHGHVVGDEALRQLADRLVGGCRGGDSVARVGGDEFVICCARLTSIDTAVRIANRTLDSLSHPVRAAGHEIYLRARIGVAWYPEHAATFDELLSHADPASTGRGKPAGGEIVVFNPTEDASAEDRQLIERDLRQAVRNDGLFLALQPIVTAGSTSIVGAEALARLDHPRLGMVQAHAFVATARATGLIYELDMAVLDMAIRQARPDKGAGLEWLAVNVSYESLSTYGFLQELERLLDVHELPAERLVVEVSTGPAIRNSDWITATLQSVRGLGVRLALDNFGPRTFSLAYLEDVEADFIKLDRSLVQGVGSIPQNERVARGIIGLADALDITTTAVGVETPEQLCWLRDNGCTLLQGFLTGHPIRASDWATATADQAVAG